MTAAHAWLAMVVLFAGLGAHVLVLDLVGNLLIVVAGAVLMWPTAARPNPVDLPMVWALVNATTGDPVEPFAMQSLKCYHFNPERTAAVAYRARLGYAVVSGDPIGDETRFAGRAQVPQPARPSSARRTSASPPRSLPSNNSTMTAASFAA